MAIIVIQLQRRSHQNYSMKFKNDCSENLITDEAVYRQRRALLKRMGLGASALLAGPLAQAVEIGQFSKNPKHRLDEITPQDKATTYNNYYEFNTSKDGPAEMAHSLKTEPWTVKIEGYAEKTGTFDLNELIKPFALEERIYRMRCVEAWSMVIPWLGFRLADLLRHVQPTSQAKYVYFETLYDPKQLPGQNRAVIPWPYREGLRMDEAMNELTLLAVGMYGKKLPGQNGAPLRLVVPWKYGFKGIKSIVKIALVDKQPLNSWQQIAPHEYGFYANVNPKVDHPRWSQASERRITGGFSLFNPRIDTQMFNGYEAYVGHLYKDLDLRKHF